MDVEEARLPLLQIRCLIFLLGLLFLTRRGASRSSSWPSFSCTSGSEPRDLVDGRLLVDGTLGCDVDLRIWGGGLATTSSGSSVVPLLRFAGDALGIVYGAEPPKSLATRRHGESYGVGPW